MGKTEKSGKFKPLGKGRFLDAGDPIRAMVWRLEKSPRNELPTVTKKEVDF